MLIRKKNVRNVAAYLETLPAGAELRPVVALSEEDRQKFARIGFSDAPANGETILPNALGPVSRFNADGKWEIHRDQPKEQRYIRTVSWRWTTWDGEEHEDFRDIYRECFPRTFREPPGIELTYVDGPDGAYIASPPVVNLEVHHEAIRHQINLLLELFGECELLKADLGHFSSVKVHRLTWKMLPPGEHPWPRVQEHLSGVLRRLSENTRTVILDRQRTIMEHGPDEQFVGAGGFSDYIAYVFKARGIVVLECIRKGNAIYVFGQDWARFSQLTKAEVLNQNLHLDRIVHTEGWKERLARVLNRRAAA